MSNIPFTIAVPGTVGAAGASTNVTTARADKRQYSYQGSAGDEVHLQGSADNAHWSPIVTTDSATGLVVPVVFYGNAPNSIITNDRSLYVRAYLAAGTGAGTMQMSAEDFTGTTPTPVLSTGVVPNNAINFTVLQATVDNNEALQFQQTTAGVIATIPNPTNLAATKPLKLTHVGTARIAILNVVEYLYPGATMDIAWNGSAWTTSSAWTNGGNEFGVSGTIGTNDAQDFTIVGGGRTLCSIVGASGNCTIGNATGSTTIVGSAAGGITIGNAASGIVSINPQLGTGKRVAVTSDNGMVMEPYGVAARNTTRLGFRELAAGGTAQVTFQAPDAIAADVNYTLPNADGTSGQSLSTDGTGGLSWRSDTAATFSAAASVVTAAPQFVPPSGLATSTTLNYGVLVPQARTVSHLEVQLTGDAANVGQTITVKLQRSTGGGAFADVVGATTAALATTAGVKTASIDFVAVPVAKGDVLLLVATPSALLTAVCTNLLGAVS